MMRAYLIIKLHLFLLRSVLRSVYSYFVASCRRCKLHKICKKLNKLRASLIEISKSSAIYNSSECTCNEHHIAPYSHSQTDTHSQIPVQLLGNCTQCATISVSSARSSYNFHTSLIDWNVRHVHHHLIFIFMPWPFSISLSLILLLHLSLVVVRCMVILFNECLLLNLIIVQLNCHCYRFKT